MGFIIYGRRAYGRVHQHEGEYAHTVFAHVDFVPLFPIGSFWVTEERGGERFGFPIKLNGRSVLATYLRVWGPLIATAVLATTHSLTPTIIGIALAALSLWSWTWRSRRGEVVLRRSDFDQVALGSRCDPRWMTDEVRDRTEQNLKSKLVTRVDARPPDDVARFGARDVDEAILAYGVLRMSSVRHRAAGKAADRLLASAFDVLPQEGGPYREATASPNAQLGSAIVAAARVASATKRLPPRRRWFHNPWVQLVGLVLLTFNVARWGVAQLRATPTIGDRVLAGDPATGDTVRVHCDRIQDDGWQLVIGEKVDQQITLCWVGSRALPIVTKDDSNLAATDVEGELKSIATVPVQDEAWVTELYRDSDLHDAAYSVYLLRDDRSRLELVLAIALSLATLVGWGAWLRALVVRRRPKRA